MSKSKRMLGAKKTPLRRLEAPLVIQRDFGVGSNKVIRDELYMDTYRLQQSTNFLLPRYIDAQVKETHKRLTKDQKKATPHEQ